MNPLSVALTIVISILLLALPRRFAAFPLLIAASYVTRGMALELGPAHLTLLHIAVAVGAVRAMIRGEWLSSGMNSIDVLVILWAMALIGTSVVHSTDGFVYRAGMVWSQLGCYFLLRIFLRDWQDVVCVFRIVCVILLPIAALMLMEKAVGENFFAVVGGHSDVIVRGDDQIRARGPFAHPILAGTVGATCLGMATVLWKRHRMSSLAGMFASLGIVWAATSSGPILMTLFILFGLLFYPFRAALRAARWFALMALIALHVVMNDPVYFLMAKIDVAGGSQGWYRAQLIRSSLEHLNEWWLAGTDYTRHWMPSGTHANDIQADITNHYLQSGVWGGFPLMLLFALTLVAAFRAVGRGLSNPDNASAEYRFLGWALGALLFGHVVNLLSITLFDHSIVYFYLILASIGAVATRKQRYEPARSKDEPAITNVRITPSVTA